MNSSDLVDVIATATGTPRADTRAGLDVILAAIADAAAQGEEISLNGFGKFKVTAMAPRVGRNPANGARIEIPATNKLAFTAAKAMRERLNR
ncbi:MAG: HU family DNA-binding protein [Sphingomonadales bacterium]|nr:HU family DNA-binding protein [Sphingomonadales bacterium]